MHRPRWIGLRPRDARHRRQRGSACGQMQKISAGKFYFEPPSYHSITSSTRASAVVGTSMPSAFAVLRLITSLYFVGHRQVSGLRSPQDTINIASRAAVLVENIWSI
jgi:hypothetical protein